MDKYNILTAADEVQTFPSLDMPLSTSRKLAMTSAKSHKIQKNNIQKMKSPLISKEDSTAKVSLPGLLKTRKTELNASLPIERINDDKAIFMGYSSNHLKLDIKPNSATTAAYHKANVGKVPFTESVDSYSSDNMEPIRPLTVNDISNGQKFLTPVDVVAYTSIPTLPSTINMPSSQRSLGNASLSTSAGKYLHKKPNEAVDELRNYIVLMDKFSLHNFMIYDGHTLTDNPEFQSFKRINQNRWGSLTAMINQLEDYVLKHDIKLAIISGPKLVEMSKLNLPSLTIEELQKCITNFDQIQRFVDTSAVPTASQHEIALIKIQSLSRRFLALQKYRRIKLALKYAIKLQSIVRRLISNKRMKLAHRVDITKSDDRFNVNQLLLKQWWHYNELLVSQSKEIPANGDELRNATYDSNFNASNMQPSQVKSLTNEMNSSSPIVPSKLLIFIPSITIAEYLRVDLDNFSSLQNTNISNLYHLIDPSVTLLYILPHPVTSYEITYYEKFLALSNISCLPKRLLFLTPDLIYQLPSHMTLVQVLFSSNKTLNRIKTICKQFSQYFIMTSHAGWLDKRLSNYLNIPLLGSDSQITSILSSKSYTKKIFMNCSMNIPIGAHDIYSIDDLTLAISRLISCNLGIARWCFHLNNDYNNESTVIFDVEKIPLILTLRQEQLEIIGNNENNVNHWFSRQTQFTVRKRIMNMLKFELEKRIKILRKDIFYSWDYYCKLIRQYGAVVEAEPIEKLGYINGICMITPTGKIVGCKGVECIIDDNMQCQGYIYPQYVTPPNAIEGATIAIANYLHTKYKVIGHLSIKYVAYYDALEGIPKMWAYSLQFGVSNVFGALGTVAVTTNSMSLYQKDFNQSMMPDVPRGKFSVYIPLAMHTPLRSTTDDSFFKLCRMKSIAYDVNNHIGSLFFLADKIVGGGISVLSVANNRKKSIQIALNVLNFISDQFGKEDHTNVTRKYDHLTSIAITLKRNLKQDKSDN
eukprot:gene5890-8125_t